MEIIAETLVVVDRHNPASGDLELLMGIQKRGPWQNDMNFPGGKADGYELLPAAAARELREETGLVLPEAELIYKGRLLIDDLRPSRRRFGMVAIFGASLAEDRPITPKSDEFDCFWVNPTGRNVLLSMPADVKYWLPLWFRKPFVFFTCHKTVDEGGGYDYTAVLNLPGQRLEPVKGFQTNL